MTALVIGLVIGLVVGLVVGSVCAARRGRMSARRAPTSQPIAADLDWADLDSVVGPHRVGVVLIGGDGSISYRNAAARGFSGTHVGVLLEEAVEQLGAEARLGAGRRETVEFYGPPRSVFVIDAHPIAPGRAVVFVDDVSESRRVDRMRTDFVTNISHELKTPIGALSVLAEALVGEEDPATVARVVDRMLAEAARAGSTVDDLLELSRIELGAGPEADEMTVDQVVAGSLARVGELAHRRSIGVTALDAVDVDGRRVGATVLRGDRRQVESALGNLVENAVRYSSEGGTVQVRCRVDAGAVEFTVADRGVGIPQRDLDRIFERFYRVDRARSRETGGTGLGLSIVRHVAANHGGSVAVESTEGVGSTFVLRLPIVAGRSQVGAGTPEEGVA